MREKEFGGEEEEGKLNPDLYLHTKRTNSATNTQLPFAADFVSALLVSDPTPM